MQAGRLDERNELLVGFADELDGEAEQAVEKDEGADELARLVAGLRLPEHPPQDAEQDEALEHRLVQLARMPRQAEEAVAQCVDFDKADRPRDVRDSAPQFLVHEVGEAAEEQAERDAAGDIIVDPQPGELLLARQIEDAERRSDHAAVERHAAVPQLEDLDRMLEIIAGVVEQHVAQPAAEDDPERGVKYEVVGMAPGHRRAGLPDELQQVPIADEDAGEVGEAVPAQVERADRHQDRRQAEIRERNELRAIVGLQGLPPWRSEPHKVARRKGKGG